MQSRVFALHHSTFSITAKEIFIITFPLEDVKYKDRAAKIVFLIETDVFLVFSF